MPISFNYLGNHKIDSTMPVTNVILISTNSNDKLADKFNFYLKIYLLIASMLSMLQMNTDRIVLISGKTSNLGKWDTNNGKH